MKRVVVILVAVFFLLASSTSVFAQSNIHVVKKGDTMWDISQKYDVPLKDLIDLNQLANPRLIFPGQQIKLGQVNPDPFTVKELEVFSQAQTYLQEELDGLSKMLTETGKTVGKSPANNEETYTYLNQKLNSEGYFLDIVICDKDTNILNVATQYDASWIGMNLKKMDRMNELFVDHPVFLMKPLIGVDGTPFIYCSAPWKDSNSNTSGWVIAYIDSNAFCAQLGSLSLGMDINLGVLGTDGTTVYDSDMTEIGKNTLTDSLFTGFEELHQLLENRILPQRQGTGSYNYYASGMGQPIDKAIKWESVTAFDKELRIYINTEKVASSSPSTGELRNFSEQELTAFAKSKQKVEDIFNDLQKHAQESVAAYNAYGEKSEQFSQSLAKFSKDNEIARDIYFVNTEKVISSAYPAYKAGRSWETVFGNAVSGVTFGDKPFVIPSMQNPDQKLPITYNIGFCFPVIKDGKTNGWIVSLVRIYEFAAYLSSITNIGEDVNFMVMNSDGTTIYDGDMMEVGKNIYKDAIYQTSPELTDFLTNNFIKNAEGEATYTYYGAGMTELTNKRIKWSTINFLGNDFKFSMNSEWDR